MLPIQWTAVYEDGSKFPQYNGDSEENLFRDINQEKLFSFELRHPGKNVTYVLNLRYGSFSINNVSVSWFKGDPEFRDYRLIYFRRVRRTLSSFSDEIKPPEISYYLGWQATINGRNKKRLVKITDKGEFFIEE